MSTRLYVEGGGDRNPSKTKCRQAFRAFLLNAGLEGRLPRIFASGGRRQAYDDFRHALGASRGDDLAVLLVDSEGPVATDVGPWRHLKDRDGWDKPAGATDDHVHLMVQCMEAWFLADRAALTRYFSDGFNENSLPPSNGRRGSLEAGPRTRTEHRDPQFQTQGRVPQGPRLVRDSRGSGPRHDRQRVPPCQAVPGNPASLGLVTGGVHSRSWGPG